MIGEPTISRKTANCSASASGSWKMKCPGASANYKVVVISHNPANRKNQDVMNKGAVRGGVGEAIVVRKAQSSGFPVYCVLTTLPLWNQSLFKIYFY